MERSNKIDVFKSSQVKKRTSIRTKLTRSNIVVIVLLVLLIELCVYFSAIGLQIRDSAILNTELVDTMGKSFDEMQVSFKRAMDFITMDENFQDLLAAKSDGISELTDDKKMKEILSNRALLCKEMVDLYLFDRHGRLCTVIHKKYRKGEPYLFFPEIDPEWFEDSGKVIGRMAGGKLIFTRTVISMKSLKHIGYLIGVYDDIELFNRVSTVVPNGERFITVFDQNNEIVVHNYDDDAHLNSMLKNIDFTSLSKSQITTIPGMGRSLIGQYVSPSTHWRVVSVVAVNQVTRSSDIILKIVLILGIISMGAGIVIQWLLAQKIIGPLNSMVKTVQQVDKGNFDVQMHINTGDELEILAGSFNEMIAKTDKLVNQVLKNEIKYKEMQLMALQSQINPHVLYNTLECINCLADLGRKEDIRRVTVSFSNLMKSLTSGSRVVKLKEELQYTEDFLFIYKIMLGDKLNYTIDSDCMYDDIAIPRLTLQPLVENSVIHGIKKSTVGGNVNVSVSSAKQGILISVVDDGAGMSEELVETINKYAAGEVNQQTVCIGVGIRNVIDRLKLVYQNDASLTVSSNPDWGTVIDMYIPDVLREE